MVNIKLKDKVILKTLREQTKITDVRYCIMKLKWI